MPDQPAYPNVLFILTDDQPPHTVGAMEKTLTRFSDGANLTSNGYVAVPLCGPARVCLLTGRYQHSHGITGNDKAFPSYREAGYQHTDLLSRVGAVRYRLGLFGKFVNGYEFHKRFVHPAFGREDRWVALAEEQGTTPYMVNVDGSLRSSKQNHTPFFGNHAEAFMRDQSDGRPWFCYLNWTDPHTPYRAKDGTGSYSSPATEETDLSDKSDFTAEEPRYGPYYQREVHQGQSGEVERLDGWTERLFMALEETGQLDNTVVIFSSDNGFMTGEHGGLTKKSLPYEESSRVPFLVRGPGFGPLLEGSDPLVSHVDITRTICAVAGADTEGLEGRDLRDLSTDAPWRERLLIEMSDKWAMIRDGKWSYANFRGDVRDKELYDLAADPYELESLHDDPALADVMAELAARLDALRGCRGDGCRATEGAL